MHRISAPDIFRMGSPVGGRQVPLRRAFLGQTTNRLLALPLGVVVMNVLGGTSAGLPADQAALVDAIQAAPNPEEFADLTLVRRFYVEPMVQALQSAAASVSSAFRNIRVPGFGLFGRHVHALSAALVNSVPRLQLPVHNSNFGIEGPGVYFDVPMTRDITWGEAKPVVRNAMTLMETLAGYPLPAPLTEMTYVFYQEAKGDFREVAWGYPLDPQLARFSTTLVVLDNYNTAAARIIEELEERAEKKRRRAIIEAVVLGVVSLVLPAVAGAGLAAIKTVIDVQEAREAAKEMAKAAKQFAATDAAFSAEIQRAAEILDYQAAQEQAAAALTKEDAEAIAEPPTPPEGGGIPTELLVGGGVAAAAAAALALLGRR